MRKKTVARVIPNSIDELDFQDAPAAALRLARDSGRPVTIMRMDGTILGVLSVPKSRQKKRMPRVVSTVWLLNQLAGMKFPGQGEAHAFMVRCLAEVSR